MRDKIADIKHVRRLTQILGKLRIKSLYHEYEDIEYIYDDNDNYTGKQVITKYSYGWGLKVTKDYVESKYEYSKIGTEN